MDVGLPMSGPASEAGGRERPNALSRSARFRSSVSGVAFSIYHDMTSSLGVIVFSPLITQITDRSFFVEYKTFDHRFRLILRVEAKRPCLSA
jgi:hypothetical protein